MSAKKLNFKKKDRNRLIRWIQYLTRDPSEEFSSFVSQDQMLKELEMAEQVFTSDNKLMSEYNREEEFNRRYDSGITIARQEGEQVGEIKGEQKKTARNSN